MVIRAHSGYVEFSLDCQMFIIDIDCEFSVKYKLNITVKLSF